MVFPTYFSPLTIHDTSHAHSWCCMVRHLVSIPGSGVPPLHHLIAQITALASLGAKEYRLTSVFPSMVSSPAQLPLRYSVTKQLPTLVSQAHCATRHQLSFATCTSLVRCITLLPLLVLVMPIGIDIFRYHIVACQQPHWMLVLHISIDILRHSIVTFLSLDPVPSPRARVFVFLMTIPTMNVSLPSSISRDSLLISGSIFLSIHTGACFTPQWRRVSREHGVPSCLSFDVDVSYSPPPQTLLRVPSSSYPPPHPLLPIP